MAAFNPPLPAYDFDVLRFRIVWQDSRSGYGQTSIDYVGDTLDQLQYKTPDLIVLGDAFWLAHGIEFLSITPSTYLVKYLVTESYKWAATQPYVKTINAVGTLTGEPLPTFVSVVFQKRTAIRGKRGRGSMHLPSPTEDRQIDGALTGAALGLYGGVAADLYNGFTLAPNGDYGPCMSARSTPNAETGEYKMRMARLTSLMVNGNLGSQNSRKLGRGV